MTIHTARHGDIEIAYETLGSPGSEPLLLVMGIGGQLLNWPEGVCQELVTRGFHVARFDNRDAGLSTHLSAAGKPSQLRMLFRPARHPDRMRTLTSISSAPAPRTGQPGLRTSAKIIRGFYTAAGDRR